jgi:hypothetical protein
MQFNFVTTNDTKTEQNENPLFKTPKHLVIHSMNEALGNRFKTESLHDLTEAPEGANHSSLTEGEIG